jgi:hypothetical protein
MQAAHCSGLAGTAAIRPAVFTLMTDEAPKKFHPQYFLFSEISAHIAHLSSSCFYTGITI